MPTKTIREFDSSATIADNDNVPFFSDANLNSEQIVWSALKTEIEGEITFGSADNQIIHNEAGVLQGDVNLTYDPVAKKMGVGVPINESLTHVLQIPSGGQIGSNVFGSTFIKISGNLDLEANTDLRLKAGLNEQIRFKWGTVDRWTITNANAVITPNPYVAASGNERTFDLTDNITGQTGTSTFAGLYMNIIDTARSSSGAANAIQIQNDGNDVFTVSSIGNVRVSSTGQPQFFLEDTNSTKAQATYQGAIRWKDSAGTDAAIVGFTSNGDNIFDITNFATDGTQAIDIKIGLTKLLIEPALITSSVRLALSTTGAPSFENIASTATMPTIIHNNADTTTGTGGVSGEYSIITGGGERLKVTDTLITTVVDFKITDGQLLELGSKVDPDPSGTAGDIYYNTTSNTFRGFTTAWGNLGGIAGSITDNQIAVGGAVANDIEGTDDFTFDASLHELLNQTATTGTAIIRAENTSITTGEAYMEVKVDSANTTGDPYFRWNIGASTRSYALGIDNSISDELRLVTSTTSATPSTGTNIFRVTSSGDFHLVVGDMFISIGTLQIVGNGTASVPSVRIGIDTDGFYRSASNEISLSINNAQEYIYSVTSFTLPTNNIIITQDGTASLPALQIGTETDGFYSSGVNELSLSLNNTQEYIFGVTTFTIPDLAASTTIGGTAISVFSVTNETNNRIITSTGTDTGNAEANLLFDGTNLEGTGSTALGTTTNSFNGIFVDAVTLGDTGLGATNRNISASGSGANIDISINPKGTGNVIINGNLDLTVQDIITDTTTGTQFGTGSTQKIAFYGTTPIVQPSHIVDADGTLADITTKFNTLLADHAALGLQASS